MKRIFSTLCLALLSLTALADEGMWLPSLIGELIDRGELSVSVLRSKTPSCSSTTAARPS